MGNVWTKRFSRNGDNAIVDTVKTESEDDGKHERATERNDVTASDEEYGEEPGKPLV